MGSIFLAQCPCDFQQDEIYVGCGFRRRDYSAPCICTTCGTISCEPYVGSKQQPVPLPPCPVCKQPRHFLNESGYYRPESVATQFPHRFPWDIDMPLIDDPLPHITPPIFYRCPRCGSCDMQLHRVGDWD